MRARRTSVWHGCDTPGHDIAVLEHPRRVATLLTAQITSVNRMQVEECSAPDTMAAQRVEVQKIVVEID